MDQVVESVYKIKTAVFEGPLEVLLRLIEERKLFINEISLAQVTEDYIGYIKSFESQDKTNANQVTGFIAVAATLILIKSKSLLPNLDLSKEEEGQIDDLEERLKLYQAYKNASMLIKSEFGQNIIFSRPEIEYSEPFFSPDANITIELMLSSIKEVMQSIPKKEFLSEVTVKKVINIEEMINSLMERVQKNLSLSFSEFSKASNTEDRKEQKVFVVVSFLAMLELVRQGTISVIQENNFEEIQMAPAIADEMVNIENYNI